MRDLIDLLQQINEDDEQAKGLSAAVITKRPGRFEAFIKKIKSNQPFTTIDGEEVYIVPSEANRFLSLYNSPGGSQFKGALSAKVKGGEPIPLSKLAKTSEFGGQKGQGGGDTGEAPAGKAGYKLNPAQIKITDMDIPAEDFGALIVGNPVLQSTDYGQVVIQLAYQIMAGDTATLPPELRDKDSETLRTAIVDNAGEYLGVLALIYNQSHFPKRKDFEEWLGGTLGDLTLRFPSKQNEKLADSYAEVKNSKTLHTVKISSKGTGGGAPPSMSGLKVPDDMRKNKKYAALVDFIDMVKSSTTKQQPFLGMNLIYKYNPDAVPKQFKKFLPWTSKDIQDAENSLSLFKSNQKEKSMLPKYQVLWPDLVSRPGSSDGGKLMYVVKKAVLDMVNRDDAIPNFAGGVLNILDMNFMQQYATYKKGSIGFETQWPAKLNGVVTMESKSGSTDPTKGGFSFKLAPNKEDTIDAFSDEEISPLSTATTDTEFMQKAAQIAGGSKSKPKSKKETEVGNVGRGKRK